MFRLGLIKCITQKAIQYQPIQECVKLQITRNHHVLTKKCVQTSSNDITSNLKWISHAPKIKTETEQEFLVRLKNDPDTFGDAMEKEPVDETDLQEDKHLEERPLPSQKLSIKQYSEIIKSFINKRQIKEAIDVVEVKMLKEDKVKPDSYIYNLLLGGCGRVGYTKKAFSLYNQMKKRGLQATGGTYTALFNACANSPWPEDGLTRAQHLRNIMIEKLYEPNETNYNAMIKAFGRCGDLKTAFQIVDEMSSKKIYIKDDTMNFLLQACIEDKEAGFRHALLVWRKIIEKNIAPSIYTYNLMVRCLRDCGIGDVQVMSDVVNKLVQHEKLQLKGDNSKLLLENSSEKDMKLKTLNESEEAHSESNLIKTDTCRPNLMAKTPHLGSIISFSEVTKPEDRLLLVGGVKGFLDNMFQNNCSPDIKTFTQLLDCIPGSEAAEQELQRIMKKSKFSPDIDFFNMLIKKRSMRFDYDGAKKVVKEMENYHYRPNLITYGVLALGCKTKEEALELLDEMKEHSYRLNAEILGAMLHQACYHANISYVLQIMEICLNEQVKPNQKFLQCLQDFKKKCKEISNDKNSKLAQSVTFQKKFAIFRMRCKTWLQEVGVDDTEDAHPWTQYRQETQTDIRHYKDKAARFKPRHTSKFKVKTSTKRRY